METKKFLPKLEYKLDPSLIAQQPISPRVNARLLVITENNQFIHTYFYNLKDYLNPGDILVLNTTKVNPVRLQAETSSSQIDITLVNQINATKWQCLIRPSKYIKNCKFIKVGKIIGEIIERCEHGYILEFRTRAGKPVSKDKLFKLGNMPLPPYIKRPPNQKDKIFYQTVYAKEPGSIAAPTAGLHFTKQLLKDLEKKGVIIAKIVLHIGLGTFLPLKEENIVKQRMLPEYYCIDNSVVKLLQERKGRVVAVGTTVVRALESYAQSQQRCGWTELLIMPGYKFNLTDLLITNFHLPNSAPLYLTAAFTGTEILLKAYNEATKLRYRFLSYGDAMLLYRKKSG